MNLQAERHGNCLVVSVGEPRIDAAAAVDFKDGMRELIAEADQRVILDLDQVDSIDSSGLGAIVAVMKVLGSDRKLELSNLSAKVRTVFRLTRMDAVMTIHDAVETALADASPAS